MKKIDEKMVQKAGDYVTQFLQEKLPDRIVFHTLDHAKYVVEKSDLLGRKSNLTTDELNIVKLCAWFHDTGYAINPDEHEKESTNIASEFLKSQGVNDLIINQVNSCILATRIPQQPTNIISQVLCDADLMHLSDNDYFKRLDKMRKEWTNLSGEKISKRRFHKMSKTFFLRHRYHTIYAKTIFQPKKSKNLQLIEREINRLDQKKENKKCQKVQKKAKPKTYSRGVESMFRTTARNQINLSSIADNKSNILISVNAIIMSITITILVTRFDEVPNIIIPTLIFLFSSLITIVFAILSTRPNISSGTFTKEDIRHNKVNLLFFGNFYNMKLDDYEWAIEELMRNDKNLYSTMVKDQYSLGKVLVKKYKLLRIAYNVFMFGIIISVIAFILAFINI